jgi:hypothetical protein
MRRPRTFSAAIGFVFGLGGAVLASPLDTGNWYQIARMSGSDAGMFDGNGAFNPVYSFGTFSSPLQSDDFHRPFSAFDGMEILFITGDQSIWGRTSYAGLMSVVAANSGTFTPNITFESHLGTVQGNILSRPYAPEDPWISLVGDHFAGIAATMIIWGENDFVGSHAALKNARNGINVFVSTPGVETPLPAALPLFASAVGIAGLLGYRRKRRSRGMA